MPRPRRLTPALRHRHEIAFRETVARDMFILGELTRLKDAGENVSEITKKALYALFTGEYDDVREEPVMDLDVDPRDAAITNLLLNVGGEFGKLDE